MPRYAALAPALALALSAGLIAQQTSNTAAPALNSAAQAGQHKKDIPLSDLFHSGRVKASVLSNSAIIGDSSYRVVEGIWVPESKDPEKALVFPQQVKIQCRNYGGDNRGCTEISVTLAPTPILVAVQDIDTDEYEIDSWDANGLVASYGGTDISSKCQRHVLTMDFGSGAVSVTDIPTHKKGCEAFTETDSYKLVRGNFYVDTTPNNDSDRPRPQAGK
jgi:hypothetical protein